MLCIIGLDALVHTLPGVFPESSICKWLATQFGHVSWDGCRLYDLIFPLFVFISGVAMSYSMGKRLEQGKSRWKLSLDILKRGVILILIGLVMNGIMGFQFDEVRYPSVLGLIGVATTLGGLAAIWLKSPRKLVACCLVILLGIGVLQLFGGDFTKAGNINGLIDRTLLPGKLHNGVYDPEGIVCVISASFLAIAGYLAGLYMQRIDGSPYKTVLKLFAGGVILIVLASGLAYVIPVIKGMWTPTFNMLACGWSLVVFALAYLVVDVLHCRKLGVPFEVIGFNALAIYVGQAFINFPQINSRLFGGIARLGENYAPLILAVTLILLKWWILYVMKKNNFRVRIG